MLMFRLSQRLYIILCVLFYNFYAFLCVRRYFINYAAC